MGGSAERARSSKVGSIPLTLEVLLMGCQVCGSFFLPCPLFVFLGNHSRALHTQGSGKTLLVRRMKQICNKRVPDEILDTQPTMGVELDQLTYAGVTLVFREVGGSFVQVRHMLWLI
jgi:hypothetical protein